MKRISHFYKHNIPLTTRGEGLFKLGDRFKRGDTLLTIIEVVPYGMYPDMRERLKVGGYYREHESYIVQDQKGNYRWPPIGTLAKMVKMVQ